MELKIKLKQIRKQIFSDYIICMKPMRGSELICSNVDVYNVYELFSVRKGQGPRVKMSRYSMK